MHIGYVFQLLSPVGGVETLLELDWNLATVRHFPVRNVALFTSAVELKFSKDDQWVNGQGWNVSALTDCP